MTQLIDPKQSFIALYVISKCNRMCENCTAMEIMRQDMSYAMPLSDIDKLIQVCEKSKYRFSFIISGGEPLLWNNLIPCLKKLRNSKICEHIRIFSNALDIKNVNSELMDLVDIFRISKYNDNNKNIENLQIFRDKVQVVDRVFHYELPEQAVPNSLPPQCMLDDEPRLELTLYKKNIYWCAAALRHQIKFNIPAKISVPLDDGFLDKIQTLKESCHKNFCCYCNCNKKVLKNLHKTINIGIKKPNPIPIPILIICKDRVQYLDITLKSLSGTTPSNVPIYVVNDKTNNQNMIKYLTTNQQISLTNFQYPNDKAWNKYIGNLPIFNNVKGICGKVNVIMNTSQKTLPNAFKRIFMETKSSYIIRIEDDVVFKNNWYDIMCQHISDDVGILEGHFVADSCQGHKKLSHYSEKFDELEGNNGGQVMRVSRQLFSMSKCMNDNPDVLGTDFIWINECRKLGMKVLMTKPRIAQHFGINSEFWKKEQRKFFIDGIINRGDPTVFPPYNIVEEIKNFKLIQFKLML